MEPLNLMAEINDIVRALRGLLLPHDDGGDEDDDGGTRGKRKMRAVRGQEKWANKIH